MAMRDWNGNGRDDWGDDFLEFEMMNGKKGGGGGHHPSSSKEDAALVKAIISVVLGFVLQALVYVLLGIDASEVPGIIVFLLWMFFTWIIVQIWKVVE